VGGRGSGRCFELDKIMERLVGQHRREKWFCSIQYILYLFDTEHTVDGTHIVDGTRFIIIISSAIFKSPRRDIIQKRGASKRVYADSQRRDPYLSATLMMAVSPRVTSGIIIHHMFSSPNQTDGLR
jgi:hypothetical protein